MKPSFYPSGYVAEAAARNIFHDRVKNSSPARFGRFFIDHPDTADQIS